jgi:hypothetical protein
VGELQVIGALRDKRTELVGLIGSLEQQLADRRVSLTHLDGTLRLFDPNLLLPDTDPQQRERVSWFRSGECLRAIYDVLRETLLHGPGGGRSTPAFVALVGFQGGEKFVMRPGR